ncbi:MAG: glycyl-radical enzyme activating protein [bacterium]|nr:glycyl-radical enzyme activating protein [bacterium]
MSEKTLTKIPLILEIKGNSLDDGPGIRSVIFFKGCPLSCSWCHNPESKSAGVEISYDAGECVGCGSCVELCSVKALSPKNPFFINRDRCSLCFACVYNCPAGALTRVGSEMSVDEIAAVVKKDKPFFDTSGGGVTLSGGEAALFLEFTGSLAKALKKLKIHVLLETCGDFNFESFEKHLYPFVDTIFYDIKLFDNDLHKEHCRRPNSRIIENFIELNKRSRKDKTILLPRVPLVPGITDTPENLRAIAGFLAEQKIPGAELLAYNPLWHEKTGKIGKKNQLSKEPVMSKWMDNEKIEECKKIFLEYNIEV